MQGNTKDTKMAIFDLDVMDGHTSYGQSASLLRRSLPRSPLRVNSLGDIVTLAVRRSWGGDRLRRLRVFGHGSAGTQGLSDSVHGRSVLPAADRISAAWMELCNLGHCFDRGGWIELHGCSVADGEVGKRYVASLARTIGVRVRAGRGAQTIGGGTTRGFENFWVEATPLPTGGVSVAGHWP